MNIIELENVEKEYAQRKAVSGISLSIKEGEVFGILGPNGAGKTTTLLMLSAQLQPTSGVVWFDQVDLTKNMKKVKSFVGVVPQDIALYSELSGFDNLFFFGSLYGIKRKELKKRVHSLLDLTGLSDRASEPISQYSGGMKRRINIAAALLHDPKVVLMDEPTVGIDPQSRIKIYELIEMLKKEGKTVIYTTHYMEEATSLCDRVAIIDHGKLLMLDKVADLIDTVSAGIVEFQLRSRDQLEPAVHYISTLPFVKEVETSELKVMVVVTTNIQEAIGTLMNGLQANSIVIDDLMIMPPNLETVFLRLTGKALRE
ncbi:ABC transporter ATP-binding protein [Alkalihalobacterium chitinilyticum]|uniref:ABC transporter ATP-binding protein n=1 Tax=Alkalihalobacterium chitinilyticum TaxID=2980103 RepID=A0ABT5VGH1_9BACI|nr:ABC transporter ATP-binding protein [Alkalihalobacterium chitinilyticum]MDE5414560.1 ABC transporter ATP-binding protein [Alkalihalobacterium chitinilyticum]